MQAADQTVSRFPAPEPEWTQESSLFLDGLIALFRASGDPDLRSAALDFMDRSVSAEGVLLPASHCRLEDLAACGKALFFALDETEEYRYETALDFVARQIKASPLPDTPAGLYAVMPFLAEYDTRFGGKQAHKAIAAHFSAVHKALFDSENDLYRAENGSFSLRDEGFMIMALADTAEKLDVMIYEHYRTVADLFLEAVRRAYRSGAHGLFNLPCENTEPDHTGRLMIVYAVMKGVRLGLLDEEKYLPAALSMDRELSAACGTEEARKSGVWLLARAEAKEVDGK